jgi:signal transduction histidine kinase
MTGSPRELSPSVEVTAYRVLQEALTNAARHGSGRAVAMLTYDSEGCTLEVRNETPRGSEPTNGERHGLVGMRERVTAAGGELTVGAEGDRDWVVRVRLPSAEEPAVEVS